VGDDNRTHVKERGGPPASSVRKKRFPFGNRRQDHTLDLSDIQGFILRGYRMPMGAAFSC